MEGELKDIGGIGAWVERYIMAGCGSREKDIGRRHREGHRSTWNRGKGLLGNTFRGMK